MKDDDRSILGPIMYPLMLPIFWAASAVGWWHEEGSYRLWKWAGRQLGFVDTPTEGDE